MTTYSAHFAWHITQALHHTNSAINIALGNHAIGLSEVEREALAEIQTKLEALHERDR